MLLYQKISQHIHNLIQTESLQDNSKLPSERELQEQFSSTRITVRDALLRLESEGLVYRQNRKGWFVCPPRLVWNPVHKVSFYRLAREQGFKADTEVVHISTCNKRGEIAKALGNVDSLQCYCLTRVRKLDQRPVMMEDIYCSATDFCGFDKQDLTRSVTDIMREHYNRHVDSESSSIHVTTLPDDYASRLETNNGATCVKIVRKRYDKDRRMVDYNIEYWLHNVLEMQVEGR